MWRIIREHTPRDVALNHFRAIQLPSSCEMSSMIQIFSPSRCLFLLMFRLNSRLTEPRGFIHDGLGNYSIGVKCSWLIDARGPYQPASNATKSSRKKPKLIRLHLEEFATECSWDHLYIYDGDSVQSPLLAVFR